MNNGYTKNRCSICGVSIQQVFRGRPRKYCSAFCNFKAFLVRKSAALYLPGFELEELNRVKVEKKVHFLSQLEVADFCLEFLG